MFFNKKTLNQNSLVECWSLSGVVSMGTVDIPFDDSRFRRILMGWLFVETHNKLRVANFLRHWSYHGWYNICQHRIYGYCRNGNPYECHRHHKWALGLCPFEAFSYGGPKIFDHHVFYLLLICKARPLLTFSTQIIYHWLNRICESELFILQHEFVFGFITFGTMGIFWTADFIDRRGYFSWYGVKQQPHDNCHR